VRKQTLARELALKALYQCDLLGLGRAEQVRSFCVESASPAVAKRALALVEGCLANQARLDDIIRHIAQNWQIERMPISDRNILRLGAYELIYLPKTPPKVTMNEAIELAKKFSTENSPTFVNGVLDRIYTMHVLGGTRETEGIRHEFKIAPDPAARADLHVHSTASDGSHAPAELPAIARQARVRAIGLLDHDTIEGVEEATRAADGSDVLVVPGVELTAYAADRDGNPVELHVGGLFVDTSDQGLGDRLRSLRSARVARIHRMAAKLTELGVPVQAERVLDRAAGGAVGRMHMALELVAQGFCRSVDDAFSRYIGDRGPGYVPKEQLTAAEAIALVKGAGGCAILCHPGLVADDEEGVERLARLGFDAIEVHSPSHSPQQERLLMEVADRVGLAVSGGSDFHGEGKPDVHLGQEAVSFIELCELQRRAGP